MSEIQQGGAGERLEGEFEMPEIESPQEILQVAMDEREDGAPTVRVVPLMRNDKNVVVIECSSEEEADAVAQSVALNGVVEEMNRFMQDPERSVYLFVLHGGLQLKVHKVDSEELQNAVVVEPADLEPTYGANIELEQEVLAALKPHEEPQPQEGDDEDSNAVSE